VELELHAMASSRQADAVSAGNLDAGFIFSLTKPPSEFAHRKVARHKLVLAAPKDHPIMSLDRVRLRELRDVPFIWFHRWVYPLFHDRLMRACLRNGALAPQIVQQVTDHATMLSLVSCRLGVAFVSEATRWQCPAGVALRPVDDLNFSLPFYLIWKKNNSSTLLREFLENVWTVTNARDN
jgi:DNA-binding transcriptional LysR family regulator